MVEIKEVKKYTVCGVDFKTIDAAEEYLYNKCYEFSKRSYSNFNR